MPLMRSPIKLGYCEGCWKFLAKELSLSHTLVYAFLAQLFIYFFAREIVFFKFSLNQLINLFFDVIFVVHNFFYNQPHTIQNMN